MKNQLSKFFEQILLLHIKTNITNGKIEGMNSKLRGFTKRAFGFKTSKNLRINIFIALEKLTLTQV